MIEIKEEGKTYDVSTSMAENRLENAKICRDIIKSKIEVYGEDDLLAWNKEVEFWERFISECKSTK